MKSKRFVSVHSVWSMPKATQHPIANLDTEKELLGHLICSPVGVTTQWNYLLRLILNGSGNQVLTVSFLFNLGKKFLLLPTVYQLLTSCRESLFSFSKIPHDYCLIIHITYCHLEAIKLARFCKHFIMFYKSQWSYTKTGKLQMLFSIRKLEIWWVKFTGFYWRKIRMQ